jgi:hypothetical protein
MSISGKALVVLLALAGLPLLTDQAAQAQSAVFTTPVRLALHWLPETDNTSIQKLGIYAALNGGDPAMFEFDTGGSGFFPTEASGSAWWGSTPTCTPSTCPPFSTTYDSGLTYTGNVVTASVQLFDDSSKLTRRIHADSITVGQTTSIACTTTTATCASSNPSNSSSWPTLPSGNSAPVQGRFFGDFGMAIKPSSSGNNSLVMQPSFWTLFDLNVITPGYRVHASAESTPWVQFGLRKDDLTLRPKTFALNTSTGGTVSALTGGLNNGTLIVEGSSRSFAGANLTSLIFDTGATTTIHSGPVTLTNGPFPPGAFPCELTALASCPPPIGTASSTVRDGARVVVRAPSLLPGAGEVEILHLLAGNNKSTTANFNEVTVQGFDPTALAPACAAFNTACFYLNMGILPFLENDVIVNLNPTLANPQLTLIHQQVPAPAPLLGLGAAFGSAKRLRRRAQLSATPTGPR